MTNRPTEKQAVSGGPTSEPEFCVNRTPVFIHGMFMKRVSLCAKHRAHAALYEAAQKVLAGLNARIEAAAAAGGQSIPVFDGIAELHDALTLAG